MDIAITKKKKTSAERYTRYVVLALAAIPVFFGLKYLWFLGQADLSIDRDTLTVGQVKRGDFSVSVRGTGVLVPANVQWLSAEAGASVEKLAVKAGNVVRKGDIIVELSNPQLVQEMAEAQWELEAQQAESKASKVAQELELLEQRASVANVKMNYESSLLRQTAQAELLETNAVSRLDYERTVLETNQLKQRLSISRNQLDKMEQNVKAQDNATTARLNKARKIYERIQQQVEDLQVKASMDSIVLDLPLEIGQRVIMGDRIAKLAEQGSLIAELKVPEIQIRDVAPGQRVIVDTRNSEIEGVVSRVDPAVVNGSVQVDVTFEGKMPRDARPDMSVDGEIKVAQISDTLYVERPLFTQSKSQSSFYKLSDNGNLARRVEVTVGHGSIDRVQVIEGLEVGDRIVVSDPSRFESHDAFRIN